MRKLPALTVLAVLTSMFVPGTSYAANKASCKVAVTNQGDDRWAFQVIPGSAARNHIYEVKWVKGSVNFTRYYGAEYSVIVRMAGVKSSTGFHPTTVNIWRGKVKCSSTWEG